VSQVERELAEFGVGICYLQRMWLPRETGLIFLKDTGEWGVGGRCVRLVCIANVR
jgi:hypothetical protein